MSTPEDPPKIRLPELPIFQKYSIALRQEFADAKEFELILEKTLKRVRAAAPAVPAVDAATPAPRTDNSPTYVPRDSSRLVESPAPSASTAPSYENEIQTKPESESETQPETEIQTKPETHTKPETEIPTKIDPDEVAFWEMASPDAPRPPRKRVKRKAKVAPAIVRVSSSGKPIVESPSGKSRAKK